MTIWLLSVLLLASLALLGWRQGVIRVAFSLAGIVVGALVATPLGHLARPGLTAVGIKNPLILWLAPPVIVFVLVLFVFKIAAFAVHRKVELYYKYKAGDFKRALWERLNGRLGLCLGLVNGTAYLILISFVLYASSYWSVQLAASDANPKTLKLLNRLGKDLESTGMTGVGHAIDRMPPVYYDAADLAGLLYSTPALQNRLNRYPAFLWMAEEADYQGIFGYKWQTQASITDVIHDPSIAPVLKNPGQLKTIWETVEPNLQDLAAYLTNGVSGKYESEKILGRWDFNVSGTIGLLRRSKPNISSSEMARYRRWMNAEFTRTSFIGMTEHRALLKDLPPMRTGAGAPPSAGLQTLPGQWQKQNSGDMYDLTCTSDGRTEQATVEINDGRLVIAGLAMPLAFDRED